MITVKFWVVPGGNEKRKRIAGVLVITNDGTGTRSKGNYNWALSHSDVFLQRRLTTGGTKDTVWKSGRLKGFPRRKSTYELVARILSKAGFGNKNVTSKKRPQKNRSG